MKDGFRCFYFLAACSAVLAGSLVTCGLAAEVAADNGARRWTLNTADTKLVLGVGSDESLCIQELCGPDGWNWTAAPSPIPLIGRIDVAGSRIAPKWHYRGRGVGEGGRHEGDHHIYQRRPPRWN